jgi:two-component sensor histidine kinase
MIRKLEVIRLMNHHVRNSLQVISFAALAPQQKELASEIRDAVQRIEWALREVLPGQREDISSLTAYPHSGESSPRQKVVG